jgi:alpha-L-fucosidase
MGFRRRETPAAFEAAATKGGWSADKWVNLAVKLHAQYITLATFHTGLDHLRAWHSDIPGTPTTKRDFLGELVAAAHKKGIKVVVYITTSAGHAADNPLMDVQGYMDYARRRDLSLTSTQLESSFDLSNLFGFGAFTFDTVEELYK